jgi:hypothetical protein
MPPAPAPGGGSEGTAAPAKNPFPFNVRSNTLDRDHVTVPAGWDSWGKIGILREGFDAKAWGAAWERDLAAAVGEDLDEPGALHMFSELVADESVKVIRMNAETFMINSNGPTSSLRNFLPLTNRYLSKPFSPGTTMRTRRNPTEILAAPSATPAKPLQESSVHSVAALSRCRQWCMCLTRWTAPLPPPPLTLSLSGSGQPLPAARLLAPDLPHDQARRLRLPQRQRHRAAHKRSTRCCITSSKVCSHQRIVRVLLLLFRRHRM